MNNPGSERFIRAMGKEVFRQLSRKHNLTLKKATQTVRSLLHQSKSKVRYDFDWYQFNDINLFESNVKLATNFGHLSTGRYLFLTSLFLGLFIQVSSADKLLGTWGVESQVSGVSMISMNEEGQLAVLSLNNNILKFVPEKGNSTILSKNTNSAVIKGGKGGYTVYRKSNNDDSIIAITSNGTILDPVYEEEKNKTLLNYSVSSDGMRSFTFKGEGNRTRFLGFNTWPLGRPIINLELQTLPWISTVASSNQTIYHVSASVQSYKGIMEIIRLTPSSVSRALFNFNGETSGISFSPSGSNIIMNTGANIGMFLGPTIINFDTSTLAVISGLPGLGRSELISGSVAYTRSTLYDLESFEKGTRLENTFLNLDFMPRNLIDFGNIAMMSGSAANKNIALRFALNKQRGFNTGCMGSVANFGSTELARYYKFSTRSVSSKQLKAIPFTETVLELSSSTADLNGCILPSATPSIMPSITASPSFSCSITPSSSSSASSKVSPSAISPSITVFPSSSALPTSSNYSMSPSVSPIPSALISSSPSAKEQNVNVVVGGSVVGSVFGLGIVIYFCRSNCRTVNLEYRDISRYRRLIDEPERQDVLVRRGFRFEHQSRVQWRNGNQYFRLDDAEEIEISVR